MSEVAAAGPMVQRASGIVVPAGLEKEPDANTGKVPTAYDADGRRRLVLSLDDQKKIDTGLKVLKTRGLGLIVACGGRDDDKPACGQPMLTEGKGTPDAGYGCKCTRIHFLL